MIDLDELERMCREADGIPWMSPEWLQYNAALRNAAPELIAMARRYQWLRDAAPEKWAPWADERYQDNCTAEEIDAAIDAAMQEQER